MDVKYTETADLGKSSSMGDTINYSASWNKFWYVPEYFLNVPSYGWTLPAIYNNIIELLVILFSRLVLLFTVDEWRMFWQVADLAVSVLDFTVKSYKVKDVFKEFDIWWKYQTCGNTSNNMTFLERFITHQNIDLDMVFALCRLGEHSF